jgi:hypothetical protein
MDELLEKNGLIMNFWNDDIDFVTYTKFTCELKKNDIIVSK